MKRPMTYIALIYVLCILVNHYIFDISLPIQQKNKLIEQKAIDNATVKIVGTVLDKSKTQAGNDKLILKAISLDDEIIEDKIKLQIYLDSDTDIDLDDIVTVSGEIMNFDFPRNPGGFDEYLYMKTKKIDYKVFAKLNKKIEGSKSINAILKKFNNKLSDIYDNVLPEKEASIVKAMVLGDKASLNDSIKELYRKAGISHILAISGLHISMLSLVMLKAFTRLLNIRYASIITIAFLIVYTIFIGASVSAIRATLMMSVYLIGNVIYRKADSITSLSVAAFILLVYQPLYLWDIGFQLSFMAVLGLILLAPSYEAKTIALKIRKSFETTFSAVATTAPIAAYHFYEISIISLIVNIVILPFVSIILAMSLVVGLIGLFSIDIAYLLSGSIYFILKFYELICYLAIKIPFSNIQTGSPNLIIIFLCYIVIMTIYIQKNKIFKNAVFMMYTSVTLLLATIIIFNLMPNKFEAVFLDVGQGDSCVIHTNGNKNILVDGGGKLMSPIGDNTGVNIIYPYLKRKGIRSLDCVIVSHPDADHVLGVIELISLIRIDKLIISDVDFTGNELNDILIEEANKYKVPIIKIKATDKIQVDKDLWLECIYPYKTLDFVDDTNNYSLVLKMHYRDKSILFTGDIEREAESNLLENAELKTDILKVAHHGSKTSSTLEFLERALPNDAIISCKKNNSFGHPSQQTLQNLSSVNANIYNTAESGAVIVSYKKDGFLIKMMNHNRH